MALTRGSFHRKAGAGVQPSTGVRGARVPPAHERPGLRRWGPWVAGSRRAPRFTRVSAAGRDPPNPILMRCRGLGRKLLALILWLL